MRTEMVAWLLFAGEAFSYRGTSLLRPLTFHFRADGALAARKAVSDAGCGRGLASASRC